MGTYLCLARYPVTLLPVPHALAVPPVEQADLFAPTALPVPHRLSAA